jgi:PEP-CTERM motif
MKKIMSMVFLTIMLNSSISFADNHNNYQIGCNNADPLSIYYLQFCANNDHNRNNDHNGNNGNNDHRTIQSVAEPSTLLLLSIGLIGFLIYKRRTK